MLGHLLKLDYDGDEQEYSDTDRRSILILDNWVYLAKVFCVNYTTYDIWWDQDSINPRTHSDIMMYSPETGRDAHPYWYACVLGIFHTQVLHVGAKSTNHTPQHIEFLWVQWFGQVPGHNFSMKAAQLPKVGFIPESDDLAFRFLDPSLVVHGCHLVLSFSEGQTKELLSSQLTAARLPGEVSDWLAYYVNR